MRSRSTTGVVLTTPPTRRYISPTRTANDHDMYEWLLASIIATTGDMHALSAAELNSESARFPKGFGTIGGAPAQSDHGYPPFCTIICTVLWMGGFDKA